MDRQDALYQGIGLIVLAAIGVAILASSHVLIVGGIPLVLPIAGLLVAIGVVRIVAGVSEGWTRGLGILGAIAGALGFGYAAIASKIDDPVAPVVFVGMGAILPALALAPIGKLIDHWIAGGFRAVRFRLLGALLGLGAGLALSIPAYWMRGELELNGQWRSDLLIAESLALLYAGLVLGWAVDRLVATRWRALRSIYALEFILWLALAAAVGIVANQVFQVSGSDLAVAVVYPLVLYFFYLFYLWLWRVRQGWSWLVLFLTSGGIIVAIPLFLVGDALRRLAYLVYTAEEPVEFAFGRQGHGDSFQQKLRAGAVV